MSDGAAPHGEDAQRTSLSPGCVIINLPGGSMYSPLVDLERLDESIAAAEKMIDAALIGGTDG